MPDAAPLYAGWLHSSAYWPVIRDSWGTSSAKKAQTRDGRNQFAMSSGRAEASLPPIMLSHAGGPYCATLQPIKQDSGKCSVAFTPTELEQGSYGGSILCYQIAVLQEERTRFQGSVLASSQSQGCA